MSPNTLLGILGVLMPLCLALQGWTFSYVVSIERRLARLEARDEMRGAPKVRILEDPIARPRILRRERLYVALELPDLVLERCDRLDPDPDRAQLMKRYAAAPTWYQELAGEDPQLRGLGPEDLGELAAKASSRKSRNRCRDPARA